MRRCCTCLSNFCGLLEAFEAECCAGATYGRALEDVTIVCFREQYFLFIYFPCLFPLLSITAIGLMTLCMVKGPTNCGITFPDFTRRARS